MTSLKKDIADKMIGGTVWCGHFYSKCSLVIAYFFILLSVILLMAFKVLGYRAIIVFAPTMLFGLVALPFICKWCLKAVCVTKSISRIRCDTQSVWQELNSASATTGKKDFLFGDNYAFFFQTGVVLSYSQISALSVRITPILSLMHMQALLPKRHVLSAEISTGETLRLCLETTPSRLLPTTSAIRVCMQELCRHNPLIRITK